MKRLRFNFILPCVSVLYHPFRCSQCEQTREAREKEKLRGRERGGGGEEGMNGMGVSLESSQLILSSPQRFQQDKESVFAGVVAVTGAAATAAAIARVERNGVGSGWKKQARGAQREGGGSQRSKGEDTSYSLYEDNSSSSSSYVLPIFWNPCKRL
ncbi:hypothetical protein M0802_007471 [Mischocyttarus mexicanus]|nr:hypothetical protein M0802_007471 [Mischocyttarus mexicanus]